MPGSVGAAVSGGAGSAVVAPCVAVVAAASALVGAGAFGGAFAVVEVFLLPPFATAIITVITSTANMIHGHRLFFFYLSQQLMVAVGVGKAPDRLLNLVAVVRRSFPPE